ncbi:MAG TPA: acetyl-CoA carboxylase biotin carboxyl carrier protein subunit, partial [Candidatus Latescibacteria bacterium]|nr:acetyl-CoA carboxylase biotin carboxyl carrier protein subunit [Candidatus Latescibacterota bacterium]
GDGILVLEAMKMEMPVTAPAKGTITDISVGAGEQVANGQVLAHIG